MSYYPSRGSDAVGLDYINGDALRNRSIWANRFQHLLALARLNGDALKLSARDIATGSWTKWEDFYKGHWDDRLLRGGYDLHREVLYNEIVIESDYPDYVDNFDATRIIGAILEKKGFIPHYYYSGSKSIHCHVYLDFAQLGKVDQILQDLIMQRYRTGNRFRKEFIEFVRGLMIRCWDTGIREFDEQLIHSSHLIRAEQSRNKKGYKTFLGYTYKDLSFVPKICNEDNRIYPEIGGIRVSKGYDAQALVEEFWNGIVLKDRKSKVRRKESALSRWSNPNAKEHLRHCVRFMLSDRFKTAGDGYKRAMFILINELKRIHSIDETMLILHDWNRRMGHPISDFKPHINSKEYSLSCGYIHSFLETLGFNDVAALCKGKVYK